MTSPDKPGETKYNSDPNFVTDYEKLLKEESQKRKEVMRQVIKSRGIEIDNSFLEEEPKPEAESKPSRQSQKAARISYQELLEEIQGMQNPRRRKSKK